MSGRRSMVRAVVAGLATAGTLAGVLALGGCAGEKGAAADPIRMTGPEAARLTNEFPDGGLPPAVGVQNIQVFRASRDFPSDPGRLGWTYNHHVDLGCWHGRLYLAWDSGERDEDVWPAHQLYATSADGLTWSKPAELFPLGVSTSLRMYFYHSRNGRMLAIAGLRTGHQDLEEEEKGGLVVREILADGSLGAVHTLRDRARAATYTSSRDAGFIAACRELLANRPFLEQQDYGVLLPPEERMAGHALGLKGFGKAFCFYHRADGALVGIAKRAWVVVSHDEGRTWSEPVKLHSFDGGNAKEWIQRTADGRFAWLHDPFRTERYPLLVLTGDDGVTFGDMRVVHGETPPRRYPGRYKNLGPQYVRGVSEWASDGSVIDRGAFFVAYSVNKEDIWVSRVPLPVRGAATQPVRDDFATGEPGPRVPGWNTYAPAWGSVRVVALPGGGGKCLQIVDRDPYDYARADRVFPESTKVSASFEVMVPSPGRGPLEIELAAPFGDRRPVRVALEANGQVVIGGRGAVATFATGRWISIRIEADAGAGTWSLEVDGKPVAANVPFADGADTVNRITFRTGAHRGLPTSRPVAAGSDKPVDPATFYVRDVTIVAPSAERP